MANRMGNNEKVRDFIFLGSKITADGDCSHEIRRRAVTNLDSILKSRDITLPIKFHLVKAMVFPIVMYGCESWTIKKAEHQRIYTFELWCWRRLLRVPWTARRSNHSILKEISPEYSLEGLMLRLKLQYFDHLMQSTNLLEKALMLGKTEGRRRRGQQMTRWLDCITDSWTWVWENSGRWWRTGKPLMLQSLGLQKSGHDWATEQQQQMVDSIWSISILVLPQKDYRRTKYLIAHESKQRITVKETKLIL